MFLKKILKDNTHKQTLIVSAIYAIIMCNIYLEFTRFH